MKGRKRTLKNGYVIDKLYFRIALGVMFLFLAIAFFSEGFDFTYKPFFRCSGEASCWNPFFISPSCEEGYECPNGDVPLKDRQKCKEAWCEKAYLSPGEYGSKPTKIFNSFLSITLLAVALAFVVNHFKHNKGFKFEEKQDEVFK